MRESGETRYDIVERLDAGGMAEVYLGRSRSVEGFEKLVAFKRILPNLAQNKRFVNMFLDEARLSLHLTHKNIVSVFNLQRTEDTYFIVMEYVDGANLKKVIETCSRRGGTVPLPIAVFIVAEVCEGLAYAHERRDANNRPLRIVHRDVSPPNVLLSRQGEVKLTDFGLAKAASQVEQTDPGVVKGKFGYLSPEAAHGESVDARTDIFAAGILLWELLAGRRLFQGETDHQTLMLVRAAEIPPLRPFNADVPPELEEIVRRALSRDPVTRYPSARDFGTALSRFLVSRGLSVTSYDLSTFLETILEGTAAVRPETGAMLDRVIQDEVNRLMSIDRVAEPGSSSSSVSAPNPGKMEDPRSWGFDDEEDPFGGSSEPADAVEASVYATAGRQADVVVMPVGPTAAAPAPSLAPSPSTAARPSAAARPPSSAVATAPATGGRSSAESPASPSKGGVDRKPFLIGVAVGLVLLVLFWALVLR